MPHDESKCRFHVNRQPAAAPALDLEADDAWAFHRRMVEYAPTTLHELPALAGELGVGKLQLKDESTRFGLNAFKVLGASYAIGRLTREAAGPRTFVTATDGNHGRAVAWAARRAGGRAVVYMPAGSIDARVKAIRSEGADVHVLDGDYDAAVAAAEKAADANGWALVQDTAWEGYTQTPSWIMAGYTTILRELGGGPADVDLLLLQGGVGSWAAAAAWFCRTRLEAGRPRILVVEPTAAAGLLEAAVSGRIAAAEGSGQTVCAGLNCATPSLLAMPALAAWADAFLAIPDRFAVEAVRRLCHPAGDDPRIEAGESGAAALAGLIALRNELALAELAEHLALGPDTRVLAVNTEGPTDPDSFRAICG